MIRLGILGCGRVVEVFHLPALAQVPDLTLTAVMDVDQTRARAIADRAGVPGARVTSDVRDIVDGCDAALVALPNHLHASTCAVLLEHGCHVLVEKPMAVTVAECDRMIAAASRGGAALGAAMVRRFSAGHRLVRELVISRTYGAVRRVTVREGVAYNWPAATGFFLKPAEAGGGVLVDFGAHVLDTITWWLGDVKVVAYEDDAYGGVEAECRIDLVSPGGATVEIELSRLRNLSCSARIEFEHAVLEVNLRNSAADLTTSAGAQTIRGHVGVGIGEEWTTGVNPFAAQLRQFAADIASRRGVVETARAARSLAVVFESCRALRQPLRGPASPAGIGVA